MSDQEMRFALVMNGGVSLAVWIAGVTHEIDLIRRATADGTPGPRGHDERVHARWRSLLKPSGGRGRRLVVDVLAGTSAGGLNGAMLANVIAHNGTLDPEPDPEDPDPVVPVGTQGPWLREVWCRLGGLRQGNLLPKPEQSTGSILDGGFFLESAEKIMATLGATGSEPKADAEPRQPVTLFTTASGLGKQQYTATDAAGQEFEVSDHRYLYRFTTDKPLLYDPATLTFSDPSDRDVDFADPGVLALAARASASFPVAFQPVRELEALNKVPPRRRPEAVSATTSWLMDGGVLDNAPFGPVLDTIAKGSVAGDVSRFIVYVVPSAGIGSNATEVAAEVEQAPGWSTALASAIGFPREVDFRSDVEELERLRVEAETAWSDSQHLYEAALADPAIRQRVHAAAQSLQPTYTRGRAAGAVWEAITVGEAGRVTVLDRDAAAPMKAADTILGMDLGCTPPIDHDIVTLTDDRDAGVPRWPWGLGPAERVVRTVLRSTREELKGTLAQAAGVAGADEDQTTQAIIGGLETRLRLLSAARQHIFALRAAVGRAIEDGYAGLTQPSAGESERRRPTVLEVAALVKQVFDELRVPEALGREVGLLQQELPDGENQLTTALAIEVVSRCTSSRTPDQRSAPFSFVRLGTDVDLPVLGSEGQALARSLGDRILYGTQVAHFGAFGADEWRRWDWLMGRLHAASHLGMLLHETSTPDGREAAIAWVRDTQAEILEAEGSSVAQVREGLQTLQADYQGTNLGYGLARMLDAMNVADSGRPPGERSTRQMGDRLVAVAPGLGTTPGTWVQAITNHTESPTWTTGQQAARWFTTPARTSLWHRLTTEPATTDQQPSRGLLKLLGRLPWAIALLAGLLILILGVVLTYQDATTGGLVLVCLGTTVALLGTVGLFLVSTLSRLRDTLGAKLTGRLDRWLPPRS